MNIEFFMNKTLPTLVTKSLRIILSASVIALGIIDLVALMKVLYTLGLMVFTNEAIVPHSVAEQIVIFFLYFGFLAFIARYFQSGYHFPLRYFIYSGITAMLRLIIVDHENAMDTLLFAGAILLMVIALCLLLYADKVKNI